jgi:uncharacterized protein (DUF58 family)
MRYFAPFLLILFVIAAALRVDFYFTIAYLFFAVYLLSRLWTQRTTDHLQIERRFTDRAFPGDQVTVNVVVQNETWLPIPWLKVHESLPVDLIAPPFYQEVATLNPRERQQFDYTLHCRQRGYYTIGPMTLQTGDLLGITDRRQVTAAPEHIIVYPQVIPLQQLGLPTLSPQVALPARSPLFEDPTRVRGVRDYVRGDSPRRIHWTATASTGQLLVKQYQPSIARETLICLDLNSESYGQRQQYTATELAIVTAASIANHIVVRDGLAVGLATEAWDPLLDQQTRFFLPPRSERAHLMGLLEVLARVQTASVTPFADLLRRESVKLSWGATLVVISGQDSGDLFDTLIYLRRAGMTVALILIQPSRPSDELQKRAALLGIPVHRLWRNQDLEAWR